MDLSLEPVFMSPGLGYEPDDLGPRFAVGDSDAASKIQSRRPEEDELRDGVRRDPVWQRDVHRFQQPEPVRRSRPPSLSRLPRPVVRADAQVGRPFGVFTLLLLVRWRGRLY